MSINTKVAWRRDIETEDDWHAGAAPANPSTGHQIPGARITPTKRPQRVQKGTLRGQVSKEREEISLWETGLTLTCDLRYQTLDRLIAACLGYENPDAPGSGGSPQSLGSGMYRHVYEPHDILRSLPWQAGDRLASVGTPGDPGHWDVAHRKQARGGLYWSTNVTDWRMWPAMVESVTFRINSQGAQAEITFYGRNVERGSYGSGSWTPGVDYDSDPAAGLVTLPQSRLYMATEAGSSWTEFFFSEFELTARNALTPTDHSSGSQYSDEPWRDGMREVSGNFQLTRYSSSQFNDWHEADTNLKGLVSCTGGLVGGINAQLHLGLTGLAVENPEQPKEGARVIRQRVNFSCYKPASIHSLFTGVGGMAEGVTLRQNQELLVSTVNKYAENVFEND